MTKLLACIDGKTASISALRFAAALKKRLKAELAVITVRSGTHAIEEPPPVGVDFPLADRERLPHGLQILADAVSVLSDASILDPPTTIKIRDMPRGHLFVCRTPSGERIPFYECFGSFVETLNHEVLEFGYNLLIIAPPRRGSLTRFVAGDTTRKLALDLHTSILVVRGGGPDSRFLVCADGSPSSRRQFPLLKDILPALRSPVDVIWVKKPGAVKEDILAAEECLQHARNWLETCDRFGVIHKAEGDNPADLIIETAGSNTVVVMGASLRHDVYRRMLGSLPMQILSKTDASVLLVKLPPEADSDFFKDPFICGSE